MIASRAAFCRRPSSSSAIAMKMTPRVKPFQTDAPSETPVRLTMSAASHEAAPRIATTMPGPRPAYHAAAPTGTR